MYVEVAPEKPAREAALGVPWKTPGSTADGANLPRKPGSPPWQARQACRRERTVFLDASDLYSVPRSLEHSRNCSEQEEMQKTLHVDMRARLLKRL